MFKSLITEPSQELLQVCSSKTRVYSPLSKSPAQLRAGALFSVGRRDTDYASLAGFLRSRGANEDEIRSYLNAINSIIPVPHDDIDRISKSISRYEIKSDFFTHDSFARVLAEELSGAVKYCDGYGFVVYKNNHWQHDAEALSVTNLARKTLDKVKAQVKQLEKHIDSSDYDKIRRAAKKLESAGFIGNSLKLLKSDESIRISFGELDENKHLLNLNNGTFNLESFEFQAFNSSDLLAYKLGFDYDANADCPKFKKFLSEVLSKEEGELVLRILGYALLGNGLEQMFFIMQGVGKNGKSTLFEVIKSIFGSLLVTIQPESLNGKMEGNIRNDLARLAGKKIMVTSETKFGTVLDAPLMKQITGLDVLTARFLHKEFFEFKASCVPLIITNYLPVLDGSDSAMERRVCVIKFDQVIKNRDKDLSAKLLKEKSGIFNLILEGLKDYQANGLNIPSSVKNRTQAFINQSNLIKCFFEDSFEEAENSSLSASFVYKKYEEWCKENGYKSMSANQFKEAFSRVTGLEQSRSNQCRNWPNLKLRWNI